MAVASARSFSQGIQNVEATRLDWDFSRAGLFIGPTPVQTIDTITLGRGTWHVQVQVAMHIAPGAGGGTVLDMRSPGGNGFIYDFAQAAGDAIHATMEAIIALGPVDTIVLVNNTATSAGQNLYWLWLAKRITR